MPFVVLCQLSGIEISAFVAIFLNALANNFYFNCDIKIVTKETVIIA